MIKIYKNLAANAIFIEDANGAQFLNSIQATTDDPTSTKMNIFDSVEQIYLVYQEEFTEFVNENGEQWGVDANATINALNATFQSAGTPTGDPPTITSTATLAIVQGGTLNHTLVATYGVGYEWTSLPSGIVTVDGNIRNIIGGSSLVAGTYTFTAKAINYNGEDTQTLILTVSNPSFANTQSVNFSNNDYLQANAGILQNVLGRTTNGTGSNDAWSISFWFKPGTATNTAQTILYFGNQDTVNQGYIQLKYNGQGNQKRIEMRYGSNNNRLTFNTAANSFNTNNWYHFMVCYDGGTTGSSNTGVTAYYGRFNFFIDGVLVNSSNTNTNSNFGYTGSIIPQNFRIGRFNNGQSLRNNSRIDELAIWSSDECANIATIYNNGSPRDLSLISSVPVHWWRMGDGDTFPFLFDSGSAANCTFQMLNMTSANIVNDVP